MPTLSLLRAMAPRLALAGALGCTFLASGCTDTTPQFLVELRADAAAIDADKARMDADEKAGDSASYNQDRVRLDEDIVKLQIGRRTRDCVWHPKADPTMNLC